MANYLIRNTKTDRLELHFERETYVALPEAVKQSIRASFYFSKFIPAWLSKAKLSDPGGVEVPDYVELDDYGTTDSDAQAVASMGSDERTPRAERAARVERVELPLNQHLKAAAQVAGYEAYDGEFRREVSTFIDPTENKADVLIRVVGRRTRYGNSGEPDYTQWVAVTKAGKVYQPANEPTVERLKPVVVSNRVPVPAAKRKPHYNLENYSTKSTPTTDRFGRPDTKYTHVREDLRADVLEIEVLLQKMEVNQKQKFDGMTDGYDRLADNWKLMPLGLEGISYHQKPYHYSAGLIAWGDYELRYIPKPGPAVIVFPSRNAPAATAKPVDQGKRADAFFKTAASLQAESDKKKRELEHAKDNTAKRLKEYNAKNIDADVMADKATYYRAVGQALKDGVLPDILSGISPVRSENSFYLFTVGYQTGGGYYDAYRADQPRFIAESKNSTNYVLKTAATIGLRSMDEVHQAYSALQALTGNSVKLDTNATKLKQLVDKWKFTNQAGFFPTPPHLAKELIADADILPGNTILEPEAGLGDMAEWIRLMYPDNVLTCCETMYGLREILELKGFVLDGSDFLDLTKTYDRIIMNPPFENYQDIDHVRHAYSLLKPGGVVVAIMSQGSFLGSQRKSREFVAYLDELNGSAVSLPTGSFKSAFRPTGVNTMKVMITKPYAVEKSAGAVAILKLKLQRQKLLLYKYQ